MTQMHPGDRTYRNQTIRMADLTVISDLVEGVTFENCLIEGPIVVALLGSTQVVNCAFDGEVDAFLWVVPEGRERVIGAVAMIDCTIVGCTLRRVGIAVPESQEQTVRAAFSA